MWSVKEREETKMTPRYFPLGAQGNGPSLGNFSRCELWVGLWGQK